MTFYDIIVIGAGPAGCQAAVSASHQMRHVRSSTPDGSVRERDAPSSKSVAFEDAPVFGGVTGPQFRKHLDAWIGSRPVVDISIAGEQRKTGIDHRGGVVFKLTRTASTSKRRRSRIRRQGQQAHPQKLPPPTAQHAVHDLVPGQARARERRRRRRR